MDINFIFYITTNFNNNNISNLFFSQKSFSGYPYLCQAKNQPIVIKYTFYIYIRVCKILNSLLLQLRYNIQMVFLKTKPSRTDPQWQKMAHTFKTVCTNTIAGFYLNLSHSMYRIQCLLHIILWKNFHS